MKMEKRKLKRYLSRTLQNVNEHYEETKKCGVHFHWIGKFLSAKRRDNFLTQKAVSEQTGIKQQTLSKYESDRSIPSATTLMKLLEFYHATENEMKEAIRLWAYATLTIRSLKR